MFLFCGGDDAASAAGGTYVFSGDCDNGSITVKKGVTGVTIVLNGLTLTNDDGAADLSAYTDAGSVSAYAEKAVQWCVKNGILTGKTASTLAPKATATRAECAAMLQRFASLTK